MGCVHHTKKEVHCGFTKFQRTIQLWSMDDYILVMIGTDWNQRIIHDWNIPQ